MIFTKCQASGNDFIIIDNRFKKIKGIPAKLSKSLCRRKFSIGADGVLFLEKAKSKEARFRMRIFNPDGSEAQMCGNGLRCIALFAFKNGIAKSSMDIETGSGVLPALVKKDRVKIKMPDPKSLRLNFNLSLDGVIHKANFINTGVPHVVYFVEDLGNVDVKHIGQKTRFNEEFRPAGANVDFVEIFNLKNISVRTYERGVEDETLSCGTGSVASAIVSGLLKNLTSPILVHTKSGEILKIYFKRSGESVNEVYLEGRAEIVFEGRINI